MKEYQDRRKFRKFIHSRLVTVFLFALLIFLSVPVSKIFIKSKNAFVKNRTLKKELRILGERKMELEQEVSKFQTKAGIDEEIREKFNVSKPGEQILVIIDKEEENGDGGNNNVSASFLSESWNWLKEVF